MKRTGITIAAILAAALMVCALAGCGGQAGSSASASSASASASASSAQSHDEVVADLKAAIANQPAFKSVTVTQESTAIIKDDAATAASGSSSSASSASAASSEAASSASASASATSGEADAIKSKAVYKFDASGDKLKTQGTHEIEDIKIVYYSDGTEAVCVTDGPVYSGTTEQFAETQFKGYDAVFAEEIGDLNKIVDCIDTVTKEQQGDTTVYTLKLDAKKYMQSDEILTMMAEAGDPVLSATFTLAFDKDGHLVKADSAVEYQVNIAKWSLAMSDFDSTVIDAMPAADKTYDEMEKDITAKWDEFEKALEGDTGSSDAAQAK